LKIFLFILLFIISIHSYFFTGFHTIIYINPIVISLARNFILHFITKLSYFITIFEFPIQAQKFVPFAKIFAIKWYFQIEIIAIIPLYINSIRIIFIMRADHFIPLSNQFRIQIFSYPHFY